MFSFAAAVAEWLRRADHHRVVVLALILLKVAVEAAIGIETHPAVVVLLLGWLLVSLVVARRTRERMDDRRARRVRTAMLAADMLSAMVATYLVGGTGWFGPFAYAFFLLIGAVALSGRALAGFAALAIVAYGVPLYAEALGLLPPQRLAGAALPAGTLAQATAAWLFGAVMLGSFAALLHAFMGLVRRGAEWHELLVQQAPIMIGTTDRAGRVTAVNPAAAAAFGLPVDGERGLVGRHFRTLLAPDVADHVEQRFGGLLEGRMQHFETRMRRGDGVERWADVMAHPVGPSGRVEGVLFLVRDVTEARAATVALARQAYHDALTGLANRVRFADRLDAAHARAVARGDASTVGVLVLDLDGFKTVNDSLGHAAGDRLLVEVAGRLLGATRGSDTVARLGGDEFAVLLENVRDDADAIAVADRIIASLQAPFVVGGRQAFVGTSIGIARGDSAGTPGGDAGGATGAAAGLPESQVAAAVLRNADAAMYQAKAAGKGRWAVFHPEMHAAALSRLALAGELRQALEREELTLAYQPVMDLASGAVRGVEALVRWRHPSRGLVMPNEFIPFAEETGLVVPLGTWVLQRACAQAAAWRMTVAPDLTVAVNVSGQQLEREEIVGEVAGALAASGLPGAALMLEITEHAVVARPEIVRARLVALRELGVRIAIDDFGTGYSALAQLQHFPLDVLKIDRAFVARMDRAGAPAAVVRALVTIGEALSLRVIAEGVETAEQQRHLTQLGCEGAQGYLWARPLAPAEATAWLAGHRAANERIAVPAAGHAA